MANLQKIVDDLSTLNVLEAAELSKLLEEKWGVSAAVPVAINNNVDAAAPVAEQQTEFAVMLAGVTGVKVNVIKEVRAITGLGLKESKDLVESASDAELKVVKEGISKEEADKLKATLEAAGASVKIK